MSNNNNHICQYCGSYSLIGNECGRESCIDAVTKRHRFKQRNQNSTIKEAIFDAKRNKISYREIPELLGFDADDVEFTYDILRQDAK